MSSPINAIFIELSDHPQLEMNAFKAAHNFVS